MKINYFSKWVCYFLFTIMAASLFAQTEKDPLAIKITDIRLMGNPQTGNNITIEVDYISYVSGQIKVSMNQPKYLELTKGELLERNVNMNAQQKRTESFHFLIREQGASLVNVIVSHLNAPQHYIQENSAYITIEQDNVDYVVYSSITDDFIKKSANKVMVEKVEKAKLITKQSVVSVLNDNTKALNSTNTNRSVYVSGKVTFVDDKENIGGPKTKGLYGGRVLLGFRSSSNYSNDTYSHVGTGNIEHVHYATLAPDGSFYFNFYGQFEFGNLDRLVLLVSPNHHPYINYEPSARLVVSTSEGSITTFGNSQGAVLPFNSNSTSISFTGINIDINSQDGAMMRNFMMAGEFLKKRYNENIPFSITKITVIKESLDDASGRFECEPFINETRRIKIDPDNIQLKTIAHEYGHNVNYRMWGAECRPLANTSKQIKEGWAIFYSFATVNYAHKVYGDNFLGYGNVEESPFYSSRFSGLSYNSSNPEYCAFACYLWNLYDGYDDGIFKSNDYTGDNDDVSGYGLRVFEIMRSMQEKNPGDYNNKFKEGLPSSTQSSVEYIYKNMLADPTVKMRSAQIKNVTATIQNRNVINFNWQRNSYTTPYAYANKEDGYRLYRRLTTNDIWSLVASIPYSSTSYSYNSTDAFKYQYQLTSYNSSGNSCGEIILIPKCTNFTTTFADIYNTTYNSNASIGACFINVKNSTVQNNASVTFSADFETIIEDGFEVKLGSALEVKLNL